MDKIADFKARLNKIKNLKNRFLDIAQSKSTPLYVYDSEEVKANFNSLKQAFIKYGIEPQIFYAVKSNPYLGLLKTVVNEGGYLDVSSQRELKLALEAKAKKIIYTGPAKTKADFELISKYASKVIVNFDNFQEISSLAAILKTKKKTICCGVRVCTEMQREWSKFGIPLSKLRKFFDEVGKYDSLDFCGIHFHVSMNKTPLRYMETLNAIAGYLSENFSSKELQGFEYIDIGGGFYPESFEGIYSWNKEQLMDFGHDDGGYMKDILADKFKPRYISISVDPIEKFAEDITSIWNKKIKPILPNAKMYMEPGRYICHSAMHILLQVVDIKDNHVALLDGGTNMIGWEKYQFYYYAPFFNLTHSSFTKEQPFIFYGSLCTPDDIWGYYFYGEKAERGDYFLLPFQGAYTYTLAQNFIKEIPPVHDL